MSLTLLDEFKTPFWCVASPVSMEREKNSVSYDYDGKHFLIHYRDSEGQVKMNLVWMKEQKQFFVISLVVSVSVCKVNKHFNRNYWTCSISWAGCKVLITTVILINDSDWSFNLSIKHMFATWSTCIILYQHIYLSRNDVLIFWICRKCCCSKEDFLLFCI